MSNGSCHGMMLAGLSPWSRNRHFTLMQRGNNTPHENDENYYGCLESPFHLDMKRQGEGESERVGGAGIRIRIRIGIRIRIRIRILDNGWGLGILSQITDDRQGMAGSHFLLRRRSALSGKGIYNLIGLRWARSSWAVARQQIGRGNDELIVNIDGTR